MKAPKRKLAQLSAGPKRALHLIEGIGCNVLGWTIGRSMHVKFHLLLPNGEKRMLVCSCSASDHRAEKNMLALVKRWMAQPAKPAEPASAPVDTAR